MENTTWSHFRVADYFPPTVILSAAFLHRAVQIYEIHIFIVSVINMINGLYLLLWAFLKPTSSTNERKSEIKLLVFPKSCKHIQFRAVLFVSGAGIRGSLCPVHIRLRQSTVRPIEFHIHVTRQPYPHARAGIGWFDQMQKHEVTLILWI